MPARSDAGSSEASAEGGATTATIAQLVDKLQKKLAGDGAGALSLSAHQSAARAMVELRSRIALAGPEELPNQVRLQLLCVGINVHRRGHGSLRLADSDALDEVETSDSLVVEALLRRTAACMLLLNAIAEWNANAREPLRAANAVMQAHRSAVLATTMLAKPPLKRTGTEEERDESERRIEAWRRAIAAQSEPPRVARAALRRALEEASGEAERGAPQDSIAGATSEAAVARLWTRLESLAPVFFRASADAMAQRWLLPDGDADFVSLEAAKIARYDDATRTRKLRSIAQSAESEAGQSVARALMLSFLLPMEVIGTRRTLLLSREANTKATLDHPKEVERAHNMAMAGTEWIFDKGEDDLERGVSVLAGVAMLTTVGKEEAIRKGAACGGRLQLPFFETAPPSEPAALRMVFVPSMRRWVLYRLGRSGRPEVVSSQCGFEGLCTAALLLVASLSVRA